MDIDKLIQVLNRLRNVPMASETAMSILVALGEINEGKQTITPFNMSGISGITPNEMKLIFEFFEKPKTEESTEAEGSE